MGRTEPLLTAETEGAELKSVHVSCSTALEIAWLAFLTSRSAPGNASVYVAPAFLRNRLMTSAATTVHMMEADIRKASLCVRAVLEEKSKMKLWLILVLFHMKRLQP